MEPTFSDKLGFGISPRKNYSIKAGTTTGEAPNQVIDLGAPYAFLILQCLNPGAAADPTDTYAILISDGTDGAMIAVDDDEALPLAPAIGSASNFHRVYFIGAVRRVQIVMDANVSADMNWYIIGSDKGVR